MEDLIPQILRSILKELVATKMAAMVENALGKFLLEMFLDVRSGVRSSIYNVVEPIVLDPLSRYVPGIALDAHIANIFDMDEGARCHLRGC